MFKTHAPFQEAHPTPQVSDNTNEGIGDDVLDATIGVTAGAVRGVEGEQAGKDTTRAATQVGPRPVEVGLGGHDDCVLGSTRG